MGTGMAGEKKFGDDELAIGFGELAIAEVTLEVWW